MKPKILFIFSIIFISSLNSFAQFKLSGKINNLKTADTITLNLPFIFGYYKENSLRIPVDASGKFSVNLTLREQKFGTLEFNGHTTTVLLTPGKSLTIALDTGGVYKSFGGTAAEENSLLYQIKLGAIPFFAQGTRQNSAYAKLSNAEIQEKVIKPWLATRDGHIRLIQTSKLPANEQALICSEIKYNATVQLDYYARGILNVDKKQISELTMLIFDGAKPGPDIFPAGPQYYYYAAAYLSYLDTKTFIPATPDDEAGKASFLKTYKISLDSATKLVKQNGKGYIKWYLLNQYFSRQVAERYLAQSIYTAFHDKDISHAIPLMQDLKADFPHSPYMGFLQGKMDILSRLYDKNVDNTDIRIYEGYQKVNSIYDVVNSLKGKVIYLDIWGTWCPACRDDFNYLPQLKAHFKGKDVAFVYLDMDDDAKDADWQKFIRINNLTGIHLRKSKTGIQQFWDELQPNKAKQMYYPTCFIFDKNGKLVQVDAKRPPDEGELYTQLEKYL